MSLVQLYIPSEVSHDTMSELAEMSNFQFKDVSRQFSVGYSIKSLADEFAISSIPPSPPFNDLSHLVSVASPSLLDAYVSSSLRYPLCSHHSASRRSRPYRLSPLSVPELRTRMMNWRISSGNTRRDWRV